MTLLYDNTQEYDTTSYSYDGDSIGDGIRLIRSLLVEDTILGGLCIIEDVVSDKSVRLGDALSAELSGTDASYTKSISVSDIKRATIVWI